MENRFYHRGHGEKFSAAKSLSRRALRLCALCVNSLFVLILVTLLTTTAAQTQTRQPLAQEQRTHYRIQLTLDHENRTYSGIERVRWINRGDHSTSTLYFHLYPNVRMPGYVPPSEKSGAGQAISDEPRLEISEVRIVGNSPPLQFTLDDQETTLRINLRDAIAPRAAVELELKFRGSVPEIDADEETGLVAHVVQQVSAAIRNTREVRRARDTNFRCRGVMMLGAAYPVLAARDGDDWFRKIESSIGHALTIDASDYEVTITAPRKVAVFTPAKAQAVSEKEQTSSSNFAAENLR